MFCTAVVWLWELIYIFVLHSAAGKIVARAPYLTDTQNSDGATPLHVAAQGGHFEVADVLVKIVSLYDSCSSVRKSFWTRNRWQICQYCWPSHLVILLNLCLSLKTSLLVKLWQIRELCSLLYVLLLLLSSVAGQSKRRNEDSEKLHTAYVCRTARRSCHHWTPGAKRLTSKRFTCFSNCIQVLPCCTTVALGLSKFSTAFQRRGPIICCEAALQLAYSNFACVCLRGKTTAHLRASKMQMVH